MKLFLLLSALVAGTLAADSMQQRYQKAWNAFHVQEGLKSEAPALQKKRYLEFKKFATMVDEINANKDISFTAECNAFSIETETERLSHMGLNVSGHEAPEVSAFEERLVERADIPASRDFSKKIFGVKNQGRCGSCWTFAATAALEGEIYFQNSKAGVSLSEQEYMECSTTRDGCQGGWMADCYRYTQSSGRIAPTSAAPYTGTDSRKCSYGNVKNAMNINGVKLTGNIPFRGDAKLLEYAASHIVSVAIHVSNSFMSYKTGIFGDKSCMKQPNHAVAVVGYGTQGGKKYWKVQNSWGTGWGDKGYILMNRDMQNTCYISTYSHIPRVQCANAADCTPADPNDGSDGSDGSDDDEGKDDEDEGKDDDEEENNDDDEDEGGKLCEKRISLAQKCLKNERQAAKACANSGIPNCAIVRMNKKCYYPESKKSGTKYIELMVPCEKDDEGKDDSDKDDKKDGECDANAGLVFCLDCKCCKHEHMCDNPKKLL